MALFTEEQLRTRLRNQISKGFTGYLNESYDSRAKSVLTEWTTSQRNNPNTTYDIFLSHSSTDAELVAGLKLEIEDLGYSCYVDWIEDPKLDRSNVTKDTARLLQVRMKQCKTLIYAFSKNSSLSKWMPWELGYFDGLKQKAAVLPISQYADSSFVGTEYLGIYYYIQIDLIQGSSKKALWVHETSAKYVNFNKWMVGDQPYAHE